MPHAGHRANTKFLHQLATKIQEVICEIDEYTQPEADDSHPGNEGNHWNNEAGGVDDAIGDGAHHSGSLDAMMEPFNPKVDADSYFGGWWG